MAQRLSLEDSVALVDVAIDLVIEGGDLEVLAQVAYGARARRLRYQFHKCSPTQKQEGALGGRGLRSQVAWRRVTNPTCAGETRFALKGARRESGG